ncbi:putative protein phosphatase 2C-like protein 44 isoform X2 [Medicago truncatula]|uniref:Phosphatase 2C family protein n=1 Tax=Medicago truncatula TaxID=3880 RepID=G7I4V1_MEDTR|nr:putative protein phosphatase 2C-like protein 44 isoform X2 [Medicago truncatula]AES61087.1 phosphatase 2C family protein [Medicago truncatula]
MRIRHLHLKLKAFRLRRFLLRFLGRKRRLMPAKKPSWMTPVTHGYQVVEHHMIKDGSDYSDFDSVVVQREQMDQTELWYFGIFDPLVGDKVTKYMQSYFFAKKLQEAQIWRKSKEMMKRAYLGVRAKMREEHRYEETCRMGSASVMVINGEKLVIANIGNYRVVVCKDGMAHQKTDTYQQSAKRHWSRRIFSGNAVANRQSSSSELVIRSESIDSDTEFLILASNGIWEVMKNQEAVNLISHIEDPQEAAECLANEALNRMSKSNISCLIIRFD